MQNNHISKCKGKKNIFSFVESKVRNQIAKVEEKSMSIY